MYRSFPREGRYKGVYPPVSGLELIAQLRYRLGEFTDGIRDDVGDRADLFDSTGDFAREGDAVSDLAFEIDRFDPAREALHRVAVAGRQPLREFCPQSAERRTRLPESSGASGSQTTE